MALQTRVLLRPAGGEGRVPELRFRFSQGCRICTLTFFLSNFPGNPRRQNLHGSPFSFRCRDETQFPEPGRPLIALCNPSHFRWLGKDNPQGLCHPGSCQEGEREHRFRISTFINGNSLDGKGRDVQGAEFRASRINEHQAFIRQDSLGRHAIDNDIIR